MYGIEDMWRINTSTSDDVGILSLSLSQSTPDGDFHLQDRSFPSPMFDLPALLQEVDPSLNVTDIRQATDSLSSSISEVCSLLFGWLFLSLFSRCKFLKCESVFPRRPIPAVLLTCAGDIVTCLMLVCCVVGGWKFCSAVIRALKVKIIASDAGASASAVILFLGQYVMDRVASEYVRTACVCLIAYVFFFVFISFGVLFLLVLFM